MTPVSATAEDRTPFFTLLTPTLNRGPLLAEAMASLEAQGFDDYEHIVLDGGSTDETRDVVARHPRSTFVAERDDGLYDALNRGIGRARGAVIGLLHSDDRLPPGTLRRIAEAFRTHGDAQLVTGGARAFAVRNGRETTVFVHAHEGLNRLTLENIARHDPLPNARFYRRELFARAGLFDPRYRLAADRDFLLRLARLRPPQATLADVVYEYRWHDASLTMNEGHERALELAAENLSIAEHFLGLPGLSASEKSALREWHGRHTVQQAMIALEERRPALLARAAARGCRHRLSWPLAFAREIASSLPGFLRRGGRTRSQVWRASA